MVRTRLSKHEVVVKCLEGKALGLTIRESAKRYNLREWRVFKTLRFISDEMRSSLQHTLIYERIPIEYASQLELNRIIIKKAMEIADSVPEPRTKLEALRLASDTSDKTGKLLSDSIMISKEIQRSALLLPLPSKPKPAGQPKAEEGQSTEAEADGMNSNGEMT